MGFPNTLHEMNDTLIGGSEPLGTVLGGNLPEATGSTFRGIADLCITDNIVSLERPVEPRPADEPAEPEPISSFA